MSSNPFFQLFAGGKGKEGKKPKGRGAEEKRGTQQPGGVGSRVLNDFSLRPTAGEVGACVPWRKGTSNLTRDNRGKSP